MKHNGFGGVWITVIASGALIILGLSLPVLKIDVFGPVSGRDILVSVYAGIIAAINYYFFVKSIKVLHSKTHSSIGIEYGLGLLIFGAPLAISSPFNEEVLAALPVTCIIAFIVSVTFEVLNYFGKKSFNLKAFICTICSKLRIKVKSPYKP